MHVIWTESCHWRSFFVAFYLQSNVKGAKDALADVDCLQLNFVRSLNQLELAIMVQFVLELLSFGVN